MTLLHGSWLADGRFFIWGEIWRRTEPLACDLASVPKHPYSLSAGDLAHAVQAISSVDLSDCPVLSLSLDLPSQEIPGRRKADPVHWLPLLAGEALPETPSLSPWQVEGLALAPPRAIALLGHLPLTSTPGLGDDLRYWSQLYRWSLSLLARGRYFPTLVREGQTLTARWLPLLESEGDRQRLEQFSRDLPLVALAASDQTTLAVAWNPPLRQRLLKVIETLVDQQARQQPFPTDLKLDPLLAAWATALTSPTSQLDLDATQQDRLLEVVATWTQPLQQQLKPYRACLILETPPEGSQRWPLRFGLQAVDDPEFVVPAATVWQQAVSELVVGSRRIPSPQETLLQGLGQLIRLYPGLGPLLDTPTPTGGELAPREAYLFLRSMAPRLQEFGLGVVLPPSLRGQLVNRLGLYVQARLPEGERPSLGLQQLLDFEWGLSIGGQQLTKREFEQLAALDAPLVEIGGEWVELRPEDIKAAREFFLQRRDKPNLTLGDVLRLGSGDVQALGRLPVVDFEATGALQELLTELDGQKAPEALPTPASFRGELRPYQNRGAGWLAYLERWNLGGCLADDMGLGKTPQCLAFLLNLKEQQKLTRPVLLICPTSVLGNWEREAKRFAPSLRTYLHYGPDRLKSKALVKAVADKQLVLTSYALLQRDLKVLQTVNWQGVVLDEAQNIKNPETQQSKAARELAQGPEDSLRFRMALTGTPVENRLSELWSIMEFLNPGHLGPRNYFQRRFILPIERYGDNDSLRQLRGLAQPFILRRLKTDRSIIADLPDKQEMTVYCGLTEEQAALYERSVNAALSDIEIVGGIQRRGRILALLTKLKQICNHPSLLLKQETTGPDFSRRSAKVQRLDEMLAEVIEEGDRALIFTQFAEAGKLLQAHLRQELQREVLLLTGATKKGDRETMVDRFQQDPQGPPIFILSLKAGGVGLNLTRANHVFHFDRWWNPAVENQATDRAFRIGQKRNVQVHKFVCSGTLEEKIDALIQSKQALAEQIVGSGEDWLTELSADQLRDLLILDRSAVIEADES